MLENCDIKERWSHVEALIERWLTARQHLIVNYCAISGIQALGQPERNGNRRERRQKFCQQLLDYFSAGHFEIYHELLGEAEALGDGSVALAQELLPAISGTTEAGLAFNDRYAELEQITDPGELANDLSLLGETLAERFDYEDQLIAALHAAHRERVA